jgi:hypothetical protein
VRAEGLPAGRNVMRYGARVWSAEQGVALTGECWEIYGHWRDDEASFETLVGWPLAGPGAGSRAVLARRRAGPGTAQ